MKCTNCRTTGGLISLLQCFGGTLLLMAIASTSLAQAEEMTAPTGQAQTAHAPVFKVLYTFKGAVEDGFFPEGTLVQDPSGNLHSIEALGGRGNCATNESNGCGLVFKLDKNGKKTDLHDFNGKDGSVPNGDLVRDAAGNLYGTTMYGGTGSCFDPAADGCGVVFKIDKRGKETVVHDFTGNADGAFPGSGLILDAAGNLYGTTCGGSCGQVSHDPFGEVFKIDAAGHLTVLHRFTPGQDGAGPMATLFRDAAGNLYGTTSWGGGDGGGGGTVFKIDTHSKETVLYRFTGGTDGGSPFGRLIQDAAGNLYGTTSYGGDLSCNVLSPPGCGIAFKLSVTGQETVLHRFTGGADGAFPVAGLVPDEKGNLYGTTSQGGDSKCNEQGLPGCGVVFKLNKTGHETVLHSFTEGADGGSPGYGSLLRDASGNLYGTTDGNTRVVFEITP
jgi:uncharacterized repeat protein (TIGR03803 family)